MPDVARRDPEFALQEALDLIAQKASRSDRQRALRKVRSDVDFYLALCAVQKEARPGLADLSKKALALELAISQLNPLAEVIVEDREADLLQQVQELAGRLSEVSRSARKKLVTRRPRAPRRVLLARLARVYQTLTGKPPRRSVDPFSGREQGHFYKFARAVLAPLGPEATRGLADDVRRIIRNYGKDRS